MSNVIIYYAAHTCTISKGHWSLFIGLYISIYKWFYFTIVSVFIVIP
jgi:hypothetical protein